MQALWSRTRGTRAIHAAPLNSLDAPPSPTRSRSQGVHTVRKRGVSSSCYIGVCWAKGKSSWQVELRDPQTKRRRHVGNFASEEDAARAYDGAAVQARGPGSERNFPCETVSELPATVGEVLTGRKRGGGSSRYIGVFWVEARTSWRVRLTDPQTKRQRSVGSYASEEDAAKAYDCAAVQAHGSGAKRNFPGEAISEPPVTVGEEWKLLQSSRYIGVSWQVSSSSFQVYMTDPQKRQRNIGYFASEEDAARAYDSAAVQAHGPGIKRNFPGEAIGEPRV
jgi:hypothetical protein